MIVSKFFHLATISQPTWTWFPVPGPNTPVPPQIYLKGCLALWMIPSILDPAPFPTERSEQAKPGPQEHDGRSALMSYVDNYPHARVPGWED
jgi:hypothetical protein